MTVPIGMLRLPMTSLTYGNVSGKALLKNNRPAVVFSYVPSSCRKFVAAELDWSVQVKCLVVVSALDFPQVAESATGAFDRRRPSG